MEESFLLRNYGSDYEDLYKPDSIGMGGGRGNGKDFDLKNFEDIFGEVPEIPQINFENSADGMTVPGGATPNFGDGNFPNMGDGTIPEMPGSNMHGEGMQNPGNIGGIIGSNDVSLIYSDDNYSSYSNIFDNAKTDITDSDRNRLISAIKAMNEQSDIESCVYTEEVIRYFVVHNFVLNFDSYTGSMIHNYYLYENDRRLSMIPWDYNLAFGGFQSNTDATSLVNYPIDSPVSGGTIDSRPMLAWIFADEEYTEMYHTLFSELISDFFENGKFEKMIGSVKEMISPYVEDYPSKFCTYEEFITGIDTLKEFCLLRAESVRGQLNGTIGSTSDEQTDKTNFVDADSISVSAMGSMGNMMGGKNIPGNNSDKKPDINGENMPNMSDGTNSGTPNGQTSSAKEKSGGIIGTSFAPQNSASGETAENNNNQGQTPPDINGGMEGFGGIAPDGNGQGSMQLPGDMQNGGNRNPPQGGSIGSADTGLYVSSDLILIIVS
ncbi:MAG: CotH kinase family protein, partial [Firmicutes bacterium]|nr:CotH kinase family protein [Bacillota bacterium]